MTSPSAASSIGGTPTNNEIRLAIDASMGSASGENKQSNSQVEQSGLFIKRSELFVPEKLFNVNVQQHESETDNLVKRITSITAKARKLLGIGKVLITDDRVPDAIRLNSCALELYTKVKNTFADFDCQKFPDAYTLKARLHLQRCDAFILINDIDMAEKELDMHPWVRNMHMLPFYLSSSKGLEISGNSLDSKKMQGYNTIYFCQFVYLKLSESLLTKQTLILEKDMFIKKSPPVNRSFPRSGASLYSILSTISSISCETDHDDLSIPDSLESNASSDLLNYLKNSAAPNSNSIKSGTVAKALDMEGVVNSRVLEASLFSDFYDETDGDSTSVSSFDSASTADKDIFVLASSDVISEYTNGENDHIVSVRELESTRNKIPTKSIETYDVIGALKGFNDTFMKNQKLARRRARFWSWRKRQVIKPWADWSDSESDTESEVGDEDERDDDKQFLPGRNKIIEKATVNTEEQWNIVTNKKSRRGTRPTIY